MPLETSAVSQPAAFEGRKRLAGAFLIDLDRIKPDPDQPRKSFDQSAHEELTTSVKRLGILQPITVRFSDSDNRYLVIAGERRFRAATAAGLIQVPCWVQTPKDEDILLHQIVENWHRSDLHPFDLADALARLRDERRFSQKELANETGKSEGEISKLLSLLKLDPQVQKTARNDDTGAVTKRHLYAISRLRPDEQRAVVARVQREQLTVSQTELAVAEKKESDRPKKRGAPVTCLRYLTSGASVTVTFRKKEVCSQEILDALSEARDQLEGTEGHSALSIHRATN